MIAALSSFGERAVSFRLILDKGAIVIRVLRKPADPATLGRIMREVRLLRCVSLVALGGLTMLLWASADGPVVAQEVEFTEAYLSDPENIERGREFWKQQCVKCHGRASYPGKAPKLEPDKLTPREIYLKTTYGFGKMPAWEDVFTDEERKAITAYMKSDRFSP